MLVRTVTCNLPEHIHAAFKSKVQHNNSTIQEVLTNLIIAFTTTPELDRISGIKKVLK